MDHPASTNSNYVINNVTTNITCMQVLTTVLLISAMDKTLARRCLAHLITNFQRCRHQPQCTCECVAGYCVLHAVAHVHSKVFLTQFFTLATHGDSPFIL